MSFFIRMMETIIKSMFVFFGPPPCRRLLLTPGMGMWGDHWGPFWHDFRIILRQCLGPPMPTNYAFRPIVKFLDMTHTIFSLLFEKHHTSLTTTSFRTCSQIFVLNFQFSRKHMLLSMFIYTENYIESHAGIENNNL